MSEIKFLDLKANHKKIEDEIMIGIKNNVFNDTSYVNGSSVHKFENNFAKYIGVSHCVGVGNGTDALEIALNALGVGEGDQVITQANTFISTAFAIKHSGAEIILVDHNDDDFMMNVDLLEEKITDRTKCIIPVHLYGHIADMDRIMKIAKRHNIYVVEDTAQAHGAMYKGKKAGSFGHIGCFSFYPGKNLGAYGDGGGCVTDDDELYEKIFKIHNLGSKVKYHHEIYGRNSRLDSIQAEILDIKLKYLNDNNACRRKIANLYNEGLCGVGDIKLHNINVDCEPVHHLYVIRTKHRDELKKHLSEKNIETSIHYPIPLYRSPALQNLIHYKDKCPNTEKYASQLLSLPMYPEMTNDIMRRIVDAIHDFFL